MTARKPVHSRRPPIWIATSDGIAPQPKSYALCGCGRRIRSRNAQCVTCYNATRHASRRLEPRRPGVCRECGGPTAQPSTTRCLSCYIADRPAAAAATFWSHVDRSAGPDGCWPWLGHVDRQTGYGKASMGFKRPTIGAHRRAYELTVGPIPAGLELDHRCHDPRQCRGGPTCPHRHCVNPSHTKPVTHLENVRRGGVVWRTA